MFDFISVVANSLWDMITSLWGGGFMDKTMAVTFVIIILLVVGLLSLLAWMFVRWAYNKITWYANRQQCHHEDCGRWTLGISEGAHTICRSGQPCCGTCSHKHEMAAEETYPCPVCGKEMKKEGVDNTDNTDTIDVCDQGHGYWLSSEELRNAKQRSYDDGYADGKTSGTSTGLAIGIAL